MKSEIVLAIELYSFLLWAYIKKNKCQGLWQDTYFVSKAEWVSQMQKLEELSEQATDYIRSYLTKGSGAELSLSAQKKVAVKKQ